MNLDAIITEWFYHLPKGYATAPYTKNELEILREVLAANGYSATQARSIATLVNENTTYPAIKALFDMLVGSADYDDLSPVSTMTKIKPPKKGSDVFTVILYFKALPSRGEGRETGYTIMSEILSSKGLPVLRVNKQIAGSSMGYLQTTVQEQTIRIIVKGTGGEGTTSTDVKENMVLLAFHAAIDSAVDEGNFDQIINTLRQSSSTLPNTPAKEQRELDLFLSKLNNVKAHHALLNDFISSGRTIREAYPSVQLTRGQHLFNKIRTAASSITKIPADKWNPGDVYGIIDEGKVQSAIDAAIEHDEIAFINDLFDNQWGASTSELVSISLKQERAQGGKAKSYLQKYATSGTEEYNLTDEELEADTDTKRQWIQQYIDVIEQYTSDNPNIIYERESGQLPDDKVHGKLAAVKALAFFLQSHDDDSDEALVALAGYGMSLSGVNPTFFKVVGNRSGQPTKPVKYRAGGKPSLVIDGDDFKPIIIQDKASVAGIVIQLQLQTGEKKFTVILSARQNGLVQGTIEVAKIYPIGDVT